MNHTAHYEVCRHRGHQWHRFEIAAVPGAKTQSIAYDRCTVCGLERETVIENEKVLTRKPQPNPEELAADLQALRTELREEVTS